VLKECPQCLTEFNGTKDAKYCSPECRAIAAAKRAQAQREAYKEQEYRIPTGSWSLDYDPWATGQLPKSVRENALWH
jgi:hypothetical protein